METTFAVPRIREVTPAEEWEPRKLIDFSNPPHGCGVYAIFEDAVCLYVGSAIFLRRRLQVHAGDMAYGRLAYHDVGKAERQGFYIPCEARRLGHLETTIIAHLKPSLNRKKISRRTR